MANTLPESRPRLVLQGAADRLHAPGGRLLLVDPPAGDRRRRERPGLGRILGRSDAAEPGPRPVLDLGRRATYLIPSGAPGARGTRWSHLRRQVRAGAPAVALEPVLVRGRWRLLVAPQGLDGVLTQGTSSLGLAVLEVGHPLELEPSLLLWFTAYSDPAVGPWGAPGTPRTARRCALCRGPLEDGQRVQWCRCGAVLHAGARTEAGPLECTGRGGCPDCRGQLPPRSGYEWWPWGAGDDPAAGPRPRRSALDGALASRIRDRVPAEEPERALRGGAA